MDWGSFTREIGRQAGSLLRWVGWWLALVVLITFTGSLLLSHLPSVPPWVAPAAAVALATATVLWAYRHAVEDAWTAEWLRSVDREFSGHLPSRRREAGLSDDPSWNDAFIGMFAGPALVALLAGVVIWVGARLGYTPPSDDAFALNLLLGAWLGLFTWTHLGTRWNAHVTARWLRMSGAVGLAVIAWTAVLHARTPGGAWSWAHLVGTLFILFVPLCWSVLHLVTGLQAGGGWAGNDGCGGRGLPGREGPGGPDGGAGRPAPRRPNPPVHTFPEKEPCPRTPAAVP